MLLTSIVLGLLLLVGLASVTTHRRFGEILAVISVLVAAGAVVLTLNFGMLEPPIPEPTQSAEKDREEIASIRAELQRTRDQIAALARAPAGSELGVRINRLTVAVEDLQKRQLRLETAIGADPARALEVPLLRRDLENVRAAQTQYYEALRADVNRVYDMNKWLLGAMAIAVVTLGISSLWKGLTERKQPDQGSGGRVANGV
ncbi:MAG TPA: hypothetical protein VHG08_01900 [Longimicrobium sp.]|nr:hypothetical protein [Longimicrobium sp.]